VRLARRRSVLDLGVKIISHSVLLKAGSNFIYRVKNRGPAGVGIDMIECFECHLNVWNLYAIA
jgi:hypothetical protein